MNRPLAMRTNRRNAVLMFHVVSLFASSLVPACVTPATVATVEVTVAPVPTANQPVKPYEFLFSPQEISTLNTLNVPWKSAISHSCKCGVPSFWFVATMNDGASYNGHFFHGPEKLMIEDPPARRAEIRVPPSVHSLFVSAARSRGALSNIAP